MNIKNNKRRKESKEKIEKAFIELLQHRELSDISVSEIIKKAELNRSTFYANYLDIYDLADKIRDRLMAQVNSLYGDDAFNNCGSDYARLFYHIKENQIFYNTYFKLGYDKHSFDLSVLKSDDLTVNDGYLEYHVEFHKAGLNAIIKKWLKGGCKESPEVMVKIIENEYKGRKWEE